MEADTEIAETILQQLGGNPFIAMTGAKTFVAIEEGLQFKIGRNMRRANTVRVVLDRGTDTYSIEFWQCTKHRDLIRESRQGVHAEELQRVFTAVTGMDTGGIK